MKKFKVFALVLLAGMVAFTSCKKDEELVAPTVSISPATSDAWRGDTVTLTVTMSGNQKFVELTITNPDFSSQDVTVTEFSGDYSATYTYEFIVPGTVADGGYITFTATLVDEEDLEGTATATVNITEPSAQFGPINTHSPQTIGSWTNAAGSYYASVDGTVYTQSTVAGHESEIDFVFYRGNANGATLCAPSNTELQSGGSLASNYLCSTWSSPNATKFGSNVSMTWADVTDDEEIVANTSGLTATAATNLSVANIIPFVTASGKKGLLTVTALDDTYASGSITIEVKVQQ